MKSGRQVVVLLPQVSESPLLMLSSCWEEQLLVCAVMGPQLVILIHFHEKYTGHTTDMVRLITCLK